MLKGLRKNNKKGFTLVELIVVLVILAILAALLIPALTGYIDKAKEKQIVAETRQIVMAAQTLVDEAYAAKKTNSDTITFSDTDRGTNTSKLTIYRSDINDLSEVDITSIVSVGTDVDVDGEVFIDVTTGTATITKVIYQGHGLKCTYDATDGTYTVE